MAKWTRSAKAEHRGIRWRLYSTCCLGGRTRNFAHIYKSKFDIV